MGSDNFGKNRGRWYCVRDDRVDAWIFKRKKLCNTVDAKYGWLCRQIQVTQLTTSWCSIHFGRAQIEVDVQIRHILVYRYSFQGCKQALCKCS